MKIGNSQSLSKTHVIRNGNKESMYQSEKILRSAQNDAKVNKSNPKRVLIALSGGIDSAVSAHLLKKQGYHVEAAFMKNWSKTAGLKISECPWLIDRQDALRVAAFLKIPMHTLDFEKEYGQTVMDYFFKEYKAGRTPNPDVMCNKEIKFKLLYNWAMKNGFDYLATGHYAQIKIENSKRKAKYGRVAQLFRSKDEFKDQTYFIYNIKTEQLPHILFPIGHLKKVEVKKIAKKIGLPNAEKKESMGLCFVGKIRLKDFLEQKLKPKPGKIYDTNGKVVGKHEGLYNYTIGQRQGIGIGGNGGPWYVVKKSLVDNSLVVTNDPNDKLLETKEIQIHSLNWITQGLETKKILKLKARFRHQGELESVTLSPASAPVSGDGPVTKASASKPVSKDLIYNVKFDKPQKAVASGQSLVLYDKNICVAGGVIV